MCVIVQIVGHHWIAAPSGRKKTPLLKKHLDANRAVEDALKLTIVNQVTSLRVCLL